MGPTAGVLHDLLLMVRDEVPRPVPSIGEIRGWSNAEFNAAVEWATAMHLVASDNDDVVVPPLPDVLKRLPSTAIKIPGRPDMRGDEPRYWRMHEDTGTLVSNVQSGPPSPHVEVNPDEGIVLLVSVTAEGERITKNLGPGHARWLGMRLIEAAAIWEQGQTKDVGELFS